MGYVVFISLLINLCISQKPSPTPPTTTTGLAADEVACPGATIDRGTFPGSTLAPVLTTRQQWGSRTWACSSSTCKVGTGCKCVPKSGCYCQSKCTGALPACGDCTQKTQIWEFENVTTITLHHTAVPRQSTSLSQSMSNMISMQNQHIDVNGWCDIGYHFVIDSANNVFQGRPFWDDTELTGHVTNQLATAWNSGPGIIQGAHSGDRCSNHNNIGVSIMGCYDSNTAECPNGVDPLVNNAATDVTYAKLLDVLTYLCKQYGVDPNNIKLHRDFVTTTTCPGDLIVSYLPGIKSSVLQRLTVRR